MIPRARSRCCRWSVQIVVICLVSAPIVSKGFAAAEQDAGTGGSRLLLQKAFAARYDCTLSGVVSISARRGDSRALERRVHVATKLIDDRLHTYARFEAPGYIRGMAFLGIEPEQAGSDEQRFVYLPSMRRIRRVGGSHSTDSFLGTDLSYHDFERQHAHNYQTAPAVPVAGTEEELRVRVRPRFHTEYAAAEYTIAHSDHAILETRYFKRDGEEAYKVMKMSRAGMRELRHCRIPSVIRVEDLQRGTTTELTVDPLWLDVPFADSLFTMTSLETSRSIPLRRSDAGGNP